MPAPPAASDGTADTPSLFTVADCNTCTGELVGGVTLGLSALLEVGAVYATTTRRRLPIEASMPVAQLAHTYEDELFIAKPLSERQRLVLPLSKF